jgi:hypothetical protein
MRRNAQMIICETTAVGWILFCVVSRLAMKGGAYKCGVALFFYYQKHQYMKKILFVLLFAILGGHAFAQNGALYIKNNTLCDVKVTMWAISPCSGNGCSDLVSNAFTVSAGSFAAYTSWTAFGPG